ncbi:hypothetical protein QCA50_010674 [Cerrena zonata]|uniref:Uncharacterized protein n=1 Tax=Cerrena zonata TaxID=2478898 RepID=A0AAW0G5K8_9APHY
MSDQRSVGLSAFTLPPPPSSRSGTPVASSTSRMSNTGMAPLLPPPAAPPSRAISPPSVPTISFDDDDFDDFQSGSTTIATTLQAPPKPISVPPLQPPISLAKPASIVKPNPISVLSPLSPPPSASSSLLVNTQVNRPSPVADPFEDDFADFHSASPSITQHPSSFSITTSVSSNHGLLNMQGSKSSGFDDFSVLSPVLRTPTPPKPPSKLPLPAISAPKNDVAVHPSPKGQSKAARHQHTLSLVELAASRKGQWPAPGPPSPLPQPLSFFPPPPPSSSSSRSSGLVDLMGEDEPLGNFSSAGSMASLAPAPKIAAVTQNSVQTNGFSLLAPSSQSTQSIPSFGSSQWLSPSNSAASIKSNGSSGTKGAGKLSAQDLSFFEGL